MKRLLLASSALVASAGIASADIALSGMAQMGLQGGSGNVTTQFVQDIDVTFTMSGTADNGLTFGAAIDLDENAAGVGTNDAGVAIFISGDFGTLTMGDTDGALDWAMQEVDFNGAASINDNHTTHGGFNGNAGLDGLYDGQVLRYDYAFGNGFAVAISVEQDDDANGNAAPPYGVPAHVNADNLTGDPIWGLGLRYGNSISGGSYTVGLGWQSVDDADPVAAGNQGVTITGLSFALALDSGLSAAANYSIVDTFLGDGTHWAIGASYTFDAITVHANYGAYDFDPTAGAPDSNGYGLSAAYDFGGGLSAHLGYGWGENTAVNTAAGAALGSSSTWSFGLNMAF
ncbi:porin [Roseibacterium sp. SDUM158016]|uniref:porin n=1 Tax=Roseicyclus sediminis TaxID=2980997 RepID=UPI0021CF433F|nr:porin [Roseibacterium sp. SDUM158016]MCU4652446.1 porin [Roseibacterium sp. SDUM158016]